MEIPTVGTAYKRTESHRFASDTKKENKQKQRGRELNILTSTVFAGNRRVEKLFSVIPAVNGFTICK